MNRSPTIDAQSLAMVLSRVADIASETLDLQHVFERIAAAVRALIPFDGMSVVRIVAGERVVVHASTEPWRGRGDEGTPLAEWSPRWRPRAGPCPAIADAPAELDAAYPMDAQALDEGMRSVLWEPFRREGAFVGGVWLRSRSTGAFDERHQRILHPIAALLGASVEHWSLWDAERRRRERLDRVETLLGTLAEALDVSEVFQRLAAELKGILPHDLINLTEMDLRARTIRISASAGDVPVRTDVFPLSNEEVEERADFRIVRDILAEVPDDTERRRLIRASGLRSWLHVPVLLGGELKGSLSLLHREPSRYGVEDAEVARRIADRIALTQSHQRLAREARLAAEAQERADRLEARVETLARALESRERGRVVGVSPSWKEALRHVGRVAPSTTTVLVTGESGTGKEVIASLIHQGSPRAGKPFVAVNCAALPETLLESELFGHEKGAFTGAIAARIGLIEQAAGGTLFLDEVAEMSLQVQAKFLRFLEQREFQRVGGTRPLRADVRVIAATNRELSAGVADRSFREDLFYRLNVYQIHIVPLRERPEDIPPLAEAFRADLGRRLGIASAGIAPEAIAWMRAHPWPGNVRELRNAIERALLLCDGGLITREHLPKHPMARPAASDAAAATAPATVDVDAPDPTAPLPKGGVHLRSVERDLLERALRQAKGNKSKAARLLGLTRSQIYSRLVKHGMAKGQQAD